MREKDKTDVILASQEQINELQLKKDQLEDNGIKTKALKHERENEFQTKMKELDDERDKQIAEMRKEYMEKIKGTKDKYEKERLLEEMGKRMSQIEQQRTDERAR